MKTNHSFTLTGISLPYRTTRIGRRGFALGNSVKLFCLAALLFGTSAWRVLASDPIGVYAFVDKVVLEPNDTAPERIQIWGGFALAKGSAMEYASAQRGYLYFKLKPEKESLCRNEWADLKSVAGTGQIVGFGVRYQEKGTLRKPEAKPENPDAYPLGWGLQKISRKDYKPINELNTLKAEKTPGKSAK